MTDSFSASKLEEANTLNVDAMRERADDLDEMLAYCAKKAMFWHNEKSRFKACMGLIGLLKRRGFSSGSGLPLGSM